MNEGYTVPMFRAPEDESRGAAPIASLLGKYAAQVPARACASERAELVRYFLDNAGAAWSGKRRLSAAYVGSRLAHLSVQDLYAFRSMLEDRARTQPGFVWSKAFWGMLKPRPEVIPS
jgi:hypothetical protein